MLFVVTTAGFTGPQIPPFAPETGLESRGTKGGKKLVEYGFFLPPAFRHISFFHSQW